MTIKTKFELGDKVWVIARRYRRCPSCHQITPNQSTEGDQWLAFGPFTINFISLSRSTFYPSDSATSYQFEENTHIRGSIPSVYTEPDMFSTEGEARIECDRRNGVN